VDDVLAVLQIEHIQRSIVGSTEERGVSGGQRKRVNIGLELAAFPTLLFLDEPTSGLDSTSSLAIVKSLKKMTQLGMTIVVVAHQPRWSLFTLFDDVLILAKGGRTAYLGPSSTVCPYFETLGFKKPSDENPADWLMDIVSGNVANPNWTKFSSETLVTAWEDRDKDAMEQSKAKLQTKATRIWTAEDDRAVLAGALEEEWEKVDVTRQGSLSISQIEALLAITAGEKPSSEVAVELAMQMAGQGSKSVTKAQFVDHFVGLEQVVTASAQPYIDTLGHSSSEELLSLPDLKRVTPGFLAQYVIILHRRMIQVNRVNRQRCVDVGLIVTVSIFLGWLNRGQMTFMDPFFASKILVFHLGLCLLVTVSCLRTFGMDRLMWWREFGSGLRVSAFYCARMTIDTLDVFLQCVLYTSMYYLLSQPAEPFRVYFLPCLYASLAASGWGYLISAVFPPQNSSLVAILFMLVTCGFLGDPGAAHGWLSLASITRWSVEMTYLATADLQGSFLNGGFPSWVRAEIAQSLTKVPPDPFDVFKACGFMSASMIEAAYRTSVVNNLLGHWYSASLVLVLYAIILRIFAYLGMRFWNRSKYA
jgi:energy-coupling factor transporter ATP-binding protein EcfA2